MTTLAEFRNRHPGAAMLVCGCGESLNLLEQPERFITVGVNDVGRRFDPTYLVVVNPREQFAGDRFQYVQRSGANYLFTPFELGPVRPPVARFQLGRYGGVDGDDPNALHYTQNSPYVALCLAAHLGATRIGLLGVDFADNHFFGPTGAHPLNRQLATIDAQYRALYQALRARGVAVYNLSPASRLSAIPKLPLSEFIPSTAASGGQAAPAALNIVSYSATPVAGVPAILARCIAARTPHAARCVWRAAGYDNGVCFQGDIQWRETPRLALETLAAADLIIVHNGKIDPAHRALLERKPTIVLAHNYGWNVDMSLVRRGGLGAVVGQYQALLPEFQDWTPVPNPMPWWEAAYLPGEKDDRIAIAYTPSGKHERYPAGHSLYWHGKGYRTTLPILERLARRYPLRLNVIRDRQLSHGEALALKRAAHIVIDECVTGSYHRNSLEGLAGGCVVVNGFGLLPGLPELTRRLAGEDPPFVQAGLDTLEAVLESLIVQGRERLLEQGRLNRAWLERCWDFEGQWDRCWRPLVERALQPAGLPTHRLKLSEVLPPPTPAPTGVSVVIPHGGLRRLPHLTASLENLAHCRGVNEVIVAELGETPVAGELARRHGAKYVFIPAEGPFERARALNAGSALAQSALILWKDNDLLMDAGFIERAAAELLGRGVDFLIPYSGVHYLTEADSGVIMDGRIEPAACRPDRVLHGGRDSSGGAGLVRRDFLTRYGGLDEAFRGWGGEDNAWLHKARLLGKTAASERPEQILYHLYHPDSGAHAGRPVDHPHYQANLARLREYAAISDGARLLRRFPPAGQEGCPSDPRCKIAFTAAADDRRAAAPAQPWSLIPADQPPVWLYWEGGCPEWVQRCQQTILAHAPQARLLGPADFDGLWDRDRDIDLTRLRVAHRADFIRAFLLARYGGLWLDSDCIVMRPLAEALAALTDYDFIAHRDRQGYYPNGFIGARPGSRIAAEFYRRVRERLRSGQPLSWIALGGEPLTAILRQTSARWRELPCDYIQPICWSRPEAFFVRGDADRHARQFDRRALCYMLSNTEIQRYQAAHPGTDLLAPDTFFRYLLTQAMDQGPAQPPLAVAFTAIYRQRLQVHDESVSGPGSSLAQTAELRRRLPGLLRQLGVRSLLDAGCGDCHWLAEVDLGGIDYTGVDVVAELIARNQARRRDPRRCFLQRDFTTEPLPRVDLILCRDGLVLLPYAEALAALRNFRASGSTWLLATTFPGRANTDAAMGCWRPLDLQAPPFSLPPPRLLKEGCSEAGGRYADKSLGLWRLDSLPP